MFYEYAGLAVIVLVFLLAWFAPLDKKKLHEYDHIFYRQLFEDDTEESE